MGKEKVDYGKGKIYRIVSDITGEQYIGSTTMRLSQRLAQHKAHCKAWKEGKFKACMTSYKVIEAGEYGIYLIEAYPCSSREELDARERYWIETFDCVNKNIPTRTKGEYSKQWRSDNKEAKAEYNRKYREANPDYYNNYRKKYYEANKEAIIKKNIQYYEANREVIIKRDSERYECLCGSTISRGDKARHERTKKHQNYLANQVSVTAQPTDTHAQPV